MINLRRFLCGAALIGGLAVCAFADNGQRTYMVVNETGCYTVTEAGPALPGQPHRAANEILWNFTDALSVPQSAALCAAGGSAWVGQWNVNERMQRFAIVGDGTPNLEIPAGGASDAVVAAAEDVDLGVFLDTDPDLVLRAYNSTSSDPIWTYTFPSNFDASSTTYDGVSVSRDGGVVACYAKDTAADVSEVRFFNGATGATINAWTHAGTMTALDLTDNGSLCFVTHSSIGRVIDVVTATQIFEAPGSGGGNTFHRISGDGSVLVLGGFRLEIYVWNGTTYSRVLNYSAATSWFGKGAAVSRDGSTVVAASYNYSTYLQTVTRTWDVPTVTLLGQYSTSGTGSYQDVHSSAEISHDGSVAAIGFWGTQNNDHPELMVFDRDANLIGSVDTPGSIFAVDLTGDGVYALAGAKAIHANSLGAGCTVTAYQVLDDASCIGDVDGDGDTDLSDLAALLGAYGSIPGDPNWNANADFNGNNQIELSDLAALLSDYGCQ